MKCEDVGRLLSLEDGDARVDRVELAEHVASCDGCRRAHPEIAWLMASARESEWGGDAVLPTVELEGSRRGRAFLMVGAAAALLLATFVGLRSLRTTAEGEPVAEQVALDNQVHAPAVESVPAPFRSAPRATSTNTLVTWHKGRRVTSSVERSVWRPNNRHDIPSEVQR